MTYYYLYKIINNINGKIYVGVHKTDNLDDGYMGSGKLIKRAIDKYGVENFNKEILEYFEDEPSMYLREEGLIDLDFLGRDDVYNIKCGGKFTTPDNRGRVVVIDKDGYRFQVDVDDPRFISGELVGHTTGYIKNTETREKLSKSLLGGKFTEDHKNNIRLARLGKRIPDDVREKIRKSNTGKKHSDATKELLRKQSTGRKHSDETKRKMSESSKGATFTEEHKRKIGIASKKTMTGRRAIFNPSTEQMKYIRGCELDTYLNDGWILGMKPKKTGYTQSKITCPYCGKTGGATAMKRWHFEKCKIKLD